MNRYALALLSFAFLSGNAGAANTASSLSAADQMFLVQSAQSSQAEIMLGRLALRNAHSQEIRDIAQRMLSDHSAARTALTATAGDVGMGIPETISPAQMAVYNKLSKMKRKRFDRAFAKEGLTLQRDLSSFYKSQMQVASSDNIRDYVERYLPKIQANQKTFESFRKKELADSQIDPVDQ